MRFTRAAKALRLNAPKRALEMCPSGRRVLFVGRVGVAKEKHTRGGCSTLMDGENGWPRHGERARGNDFPAIRHGESVRNWGAPQTAPARGDAPMRLAARTLREACPCTHCSKTLECAAMVSGNAARSVRQSADACVTANDQARIRRRCQRHGMCRHRRTRQMLKLARRESCGQAS